MSRPTTLSTAIKEILANHAQGIPLSQVHLLLGPAAPSLATLIRALRRLAASGEIRKEGQSRAAVYKPSVTASNPSPVTTPEPTLTPASQQLRLSIAQPLHARALAGYSPRFLQDYRPNHTHYLDDAQRRHLASIGTTAPSHAAAGTYIRHILDRLLIDLSWNSSRLEGNTYSLLDTHRLIATGARAEGKAAADAQMILNHKRAIEFIIAGMPDIQPDAATLLNLHAILSANLLPDSAAEGRLRHRWVGIAGSVFHPLGSGNDIAREFQSIADKACSIENPFEQAIFLMAHLPYLQPFEDVNKRVSRLAANIPLIKANLSPLSFTDVPQPLYIDALLAVYETTAIDLLRDVFLWAYERSAARYAAIRQQTGAPDPFRLRLDKQLQHVIATVIQATLNQQAAAAFIAEYAAASLASEDTQRFVELAERELLNLTEGNFGRYAVTKAQFHAWHARWTLAADSVVPA